mmetsp:Transcript_571/g.1594  ORF Transcript_571/g.1594 Transcript_571/m.1594 type:complete len:213 (+) Transcript_571:671-1309(+)
MRCLCAPTSRQPRAPSSRTTSAPTSCSLVSGCRLPAHSPRWVCLASLALHCRQALLAPLRQAAQARLSCASMCPRCFCAARMRTGPAHMWWSLCYARSRAGVWFPERRWTALHPRRRATRRAAHFLRETRELPRCRNGPTCVTSTARMGPSGVAYPSSGTTPAMPGETLACTAGSTPPAPPRPACGATWVQTAPRLGGLAPVGTLRLGVRCV